MEGKPHHFLETLGSLELTEGSTAPPAYANSSQLVFPDYDKADKDWDPGRQHMRALSFIADDPLYLKEKSFCINIPLPSGQPRSNLSFDKRLVAFCDARGREDTFSLDTHGFCFVKMPELSIDIHDTHALRSVFIAEMEQWLQDRFKADMVHVFDYTVCSGRSLLSQQLIGLLKLTYLIVRSVRLSHSGIPTTTTNRDLLHRGLTSVRHYSLELLKHLSRYYPTDSHTDQTPNAAVRRLTLHLQNLTDLYKGRIQLVK